MNAETLARRLAKRGTDIGILAQSVIRTPELLDPVVAGLGSELANVRFNASKVLLAMAQASPETIQPQLGAILRLLDCDNKILKAAAIRTLGHAARADPRGRITRALDKILQLIPGPDLVVAANAIEGAALIAQAKPQLTDRVVRALLSVEKGHYRTAECRNIAIGKVLDALSGLYSQSRLEQRIEGFAGRQRENSRKATRERAEPPSRPASSCTSAREALAQTRPSGSVHGLSRRPSHGAGSPCAATPARTASRALPWPPRCPELARSGRPSYRRSSEAPPR